MAGLFKRKHSKQSSIKGINEGNVEKTSKNSDFGRVFNESMVANRSFDVPIPKRSISDPKEQRPPLASSSSVPAQRLKSPWTKKKLYNSPFPRFSHAASSITSDQGAIYLMGGLSSNAVYGDMWVIEPIKQKGNTSVHPYIASPIENYERVPSPRTGHASVLVGNAFIVFGGDTVIDDNDQFLDNKLYFFNISSLKWTITSPEGERPQGRYGHQISVLNFEIPKKPGHWLSYLYVFGGQMDDHYFNDVWKFDLSNFRNPKTTWQKMECTGDIPPPLANHSMVAYNDKLFIYGGNNGSKFNKNIYCFDPMKNYWEKLNFHGRFQPPALSEHSVTIFQNLLFIYGGKLENDIISDDFYAIDLNNMNSFKLLSNLPYSPGARCGHSISLNATEQKIIVMGGDKYDNNFQGVDPDGVSVIDEHQFSYQSSVIFEFDIQRLDEFMEKVNPQSLPVISSTPLSSKSNLDLSELPDTSNVEQKQAHRLSYLKSDTSSVDHAKDIDETVNILAESTQSEGRIQSSDSYMKKEESIFNDYGEIEGDDTVLNNEDYEGGATFEITSPVNDVDRVENVTSPSDFTNVSNTVSSNNTALPVITSNVSPVDQVEYKNPSTPSLSHRLEPNGVPIMPFSPAFMERDNEKMNKLVKIVGEVKSELNSKVLEANKKIHSLVDEKDELEMKLKKLEAETLSLDQFRELNEILKSQQLKIEEMGKRLLDEEALHEKIINLEKDNELLTHKYENLRIIHGVLNDEGDTEIKQKEDNKVQLLNEKIDNLLINWENKQNPIENGDMVQKIHEIESELKMKDIQLKEFENKNRETIGSLNKTYKALHVSQGELGKYREENITLKNQLEELKISKRIYSNGSGSRVPSPMQSKANVESEESVDESDPLLVKLKDLEVHLYIVSQERDQLKDELLQAKKQLYANGVH